MYELYDVSEIPDYWERRPVDGGPWRGPGLVEWVDRIAAPMLRPGETLPLIKPFPTAPAIGADVGGSDAVHPGVRRPAAHP